MTIDLNSTETAIFRDLIAAMTAGQQAEQMLMRIAAGIAKRAGVPDSPHRLAPSADCLTLIATPMATGPSEDRAQPKAE